ncbi:PREDICTED: uncharacterized protein LOC101367924 [Odobenus rosmarus divergens]|uniref:Uncharacterized protein LOC101367924 n=1 Tax=Odobenus rosmarus divergens TaxID=9708 RepID=A0A9B0HDW9_ODORO
MLGMIQMENDCLPRHGGGAHEKDKAGRVQTALDKADDFLNVTIECLLEINEHLEGELGDDRAGIAVELELLLSLKSVLLAVLMLPTLSRPMYHLFPGMTCPDDEVVLQCTATIHKEQQKLCLAAEGFGNRLCFLESTSNSKNVPPDLSICTFVLEQSLSVRALQEMLANTVEKSEGVKSEVSARYLSWGPGCPRQEAWSGKGSGKLPLTSDCWVPHTSAPCPELLPLSVPWEHGRRGELAGSLDGSAVHQACQVLKLTRFGGHLGGFSGACPSPEI